MAVVDGYPDAFLILRDKKSRGQRNPGRNLEALFPCSVQWEGGDVILGSIGRVSSLLCFIGVADLWQCSRIDDAGWTSGLHRCYDRSLYQSNKSQPTKMITMFDPQMAVHTATLADKEEIQSAQEDALLCSLFAHADELAFGSSTTDPKGMLSLAFTAVKPVIHLAKR